MPFYLTPDDRSQIPELHACPAEGFRRSRSSWVRLCSAALLLIAMLSPALALSGKNPVRHQVDIYSDTYTIDRKYKSMEGPSSRRTVALVQSEHPELLWITGYRAIVVEEDKVTPTLQDFMCHSNLDIDMARHRDLFGWVKYPSRRLFTLSQGQTSIEFPAGFGIPVLSSEPLFLTTQVLNHNIKDSSFRVRHKVTIQFVRDTELKKPLKPLYMSAANGLVHLQGEGRHYGMEHADRENHGPGAMHGLSASSRSYRDKFGRMFAGHWIVKPGRQVNHTLVTKWLNLPFDTKVHYIGVHLHPFAETLELRDLTAGKTIFKSRARNPEGKVGLEYVESFSSAEGISLFREHEYELVSTYNNTSGEDQTAMAVMYMYLFDKEFKKPDTKRMSAPRR